MLIVLGMLSFLLISSVAFAVYMRVERMATSNYRHSVMARQLIQLAFADARNTVGEIVGENGSTFWPIFYPKTPEARVLMSLPKWRDSDGDMRDTDYPDSYTTGATESATEGTGLSFTPGAGPSLLSDEVIKHVPPALVRDVMNARWQAQWRPIKQPQLVESQSGGSVSVNPVVGRYAWMAINVSDMLDANTMGTNTLSGQRNFGSLGGADWKLDGTGGILGSASTYKSAADLGDFKARFLTGADLASLADYSGGLFNQKVLDWRSAVGLSTLGGTIDDAAPLTVYSRFPVAPPYAELPADTLSPAVSVRISDWTNGAAISMGELNSDMTATIRSKLGKALGNFKSNMDVKDFEAMIREYVSENDGVLSPGSGYPMLRPPMKPVPMISQIFYDAPSIRGALFASPAAEANPDYILNPMTIPASEPGLTLAVQLANLFDEDAPAGTIQAEGYWALALGYGNGIPAAYSSKQGWTAPNVSIEGVSKGKFSSSQIKFPVPPVSPITIPAAQLGSSPIIYLDLFFRLVISGMDEVPYSTFTQTPQDGNTTPSQIGFAGERYFRIRFAWKIVKESGNPLATPPTPDKYRAEAIPAPDNGTWAESGVWDCIDPRYNWFSPMAMIAVSAPAKVQRILDYYSLSGYDKDKSSIHWFFRTTGGKSVDYPNPAMQTVMDFAQNNPDKGMDVVDLNTTSKTSSGYKEDNSDRYYAFSHSGLGRMYSPLEFGFFPRFLYAVSAIPDTWVPNTTGWENNLPFYRSVRVYPHANSTATAVAVDKAFLSYFAESTGTRRGLLYGGSPGVAGDYLRDLQFNGLPSALSKIGKTDGLITPATYPELDAAQLSLRGWLASFYDNKFKDLAASASDVADGQGLRELYYSDVPIASIPPTVASGLALDIFREIAEIKKLPEVKRKLLAALGQCGTSRRQQLFLYILRADAYKPIIGDSLSGGSSSASCRAVALVWRDPFAKGAETMSSTAATGLYRKEWFRGESAGAATGGTTATTVSEHAERLIYFQILD